MFLIENLKYYVTLGSVVYGTLTFMTILNISEVQAKFDFLHSCLMKAVDTLFHPGKLKSRQPTNHGSPQVWNSWLHSAKKPSLNGERLLTTTSNLGIESRKRVLNVRHLFMRTKFLVCRTLISLDGGRTLKIWVAFRAPVIGHLSWLAAKFLMKLH